jgi:hypothetical protein
MTPIFPSGSSAAAPRTAEPGKRCPPVCIQTGPGLTGASSSMYGAINAPRTGNGSFEQFAANVVTTDEPGLGVTVPFTPPNGASPTSSAAVPTIIPIPTTVPTLPNLTTIPIPNTTTVSSSSGPVPLIKNSTVGSDHLTGAAGSVTARSTVVLGLAGLAAGLVL